MIEISEEDLQQIIGGYQQNPKDTIKSPPKPTPTFNPTRPKPIPRDTVRLPAPTTFGTTPVGHP